MSTQTPCGTALVRLLEAYGVDTVFGIPGVHTLDLYRGLADSAVRHVLVRHEQGAGFIADGYARASGRPGVCFVITGPGVTNIATPMGEAYANSVPMLVISSVNETWTLGKGWGRLHEVTDQRATTAPLTAFSATALVPSDLPDLLAQAFTVFDSARPRPVHIEIPLDVLAASVDDGWAPRPTAPRPAPAPAAVEAAADLLAGAARPIVVAGGGAVAAGAEVAGIAEACGALVVTTTAAKGVVPDSHPLSLGGTLSLTPTLACLADADVVLALGTELADTDTWVERLELAGKLIRVDIDAAKMNDMYAPAVAIQADAKPAAAAILAALADRRRNVSLDEATARAAAVRTQGAQADSPLVARHRRVLEALRRALPADAIVSTDATQLAYTGNFAFATEQPGCWYHPVGYCALGYGLPAAIGAKIGAPDRPVAAISGDTGLLFTVQELSTAVDLGLSIPIVLWNNDGLGQISDDMAARDIPLIGVRSRNPDYQALALAFGCRAAAPPDLAAFEAAVAEALEAPVPTLIEMRQDDPALD